MDALVYHAFVDEMEKKAVAERVARLLATDIPSTPRLLMKKRSPAELKGIQDSVEGLGKKYVEKPLMRVAEKGLKHIPEGKMQDVARSGAKAVAKDPLTLATLPIPVPGATPAYVGGKKLIERGIDKAFPVGSK